MPRLEPAEPTQVHDSGNGPERSAALLMIIAAQPLKAMRIGVELDPHARLAVKDRVAAAATARIAAGAAIIGRVKHCLLLNPEMVLTGPTVGGQECSRARAAIEGPAAVRISEIP